MTLIALVVALQVSAAEPASADLATFIPATKLSAWCNSAEDTEAAACLQFILGVADAEQQHAAFGGAAWVCRPQGHTAGEMKSLVQSAFVREPRLLQLGAANAVTLALQDAFPCSPSRRK